MHYKNVTSSKNNPLGDRQKFYDENIQGCYDYYEKDWQRCLNNERSRIAMSLRQPQSMINYTKTGYTKVRAPDDVFKLLKQFWDLNRDQAKPEKWGVGNTYTNHWKAPTLMVSVEDRSLKGAGWKLKQGKNIECTFLMKFLHHFLTHFHFRQCRCLGRSSQYHRRVDWNATCRVLSLWY